MTATHCTPLPMPPSTAPSTRPAASARRPSRVAGADRGRRDEHQRRHRPPARAGRRRRADARSRRPRTPSRRPKPRLVEFSVSLRVDDLDRHDQREEQDRDRLRRRSAARPSDGRARTPARRARVARQRSRGPCVGLGQAARAGQQQQRDGHERRRRRTSSAVASAPLRARSGRRAPARPRSMTAKATLISALPSRSAPAGRQHGRDRAARSGRAR